MSELQTRPTAEDFPREVLDIFHDYVHGEIGRRAFIDRCGRVVGSTAVATGMLAALTPDFAFAQKIAPTDGRITTTREDIASPSGNGTIKAYVARPKGTSVRAKKPVVLVVHENRGLNPHIEDVTRRLAVDGFLAVAPDALTSKGGYPGDEQKAAALFRELDQPKVREDFVAAAAWAQKLPDGNGKLGTVGFCYGGGMVNLLATRVPTLRAGVPFYGGAAPAEGVPNIKAELLLHFAGNDTRINEAWPAYEANLKKAGVKYQAFTYPGVEHGFNNDTTPRYNEKAAALAWERTLALFKRTLA